MDRNELLLQLQEQDEPSSSRVAVSFEFFPPGTEAMNEILWRSIQRLAPLAPRFVSVTYGADGSTRERTHAVVRRLIQETTLTPAPHLTCVDASREQIDNIAREYLEMGVKHIVALRVHFHAFATGRHASGCL